MADFVLHRTDDVGSDVILIAGQSNAAEFGVGKDATFLDTSDQRIRQWAMSGTYLGRSIVAVDGQMQYRIPTADTTRIGFATTFARNWVRGLPLNRHVLIVPAAQGSTGFTTSSLASPPTGYTQGQDGTNSGSWDPAKGDGGYSLYQAAIDATNAAIAANANNRLVAILWIQGEADGTLTQSTYAPKLDALITGFRASITGAATVPFIIGQMVPDWVSFNAGINAAHIDTPRRQQRTAFAYGFTGMSNTSPVEAFHYNAAGQRAMGKALYDLIPTARANVTGVAPLTPGAVTLVQDSTTQTTVHVTWVRPVGRATDYTVQYSTNAGTSWATLTRAQSIDKTADITGIAVGTAVLVRVATVNEAGTSAYSTSSSLTTVYKYETNTVLPAITGTATVGSVLTVTPGTWTPTQDTLTYQWNRAGVAISGATATTYTLVSGDSGQSITVTETAVKSGIGTRTATSTGVVPGGTAMPTGYQYMWKVGDLSAVADNAVVTSWSSDSASATSLPLTQGTTAKKPTVITDTGKRYVRFDGTDDALNFTPPAAFAQPYTVVFRGRFRNLTTEESGIIRDGTTGSEFGVRYTGAAIMASPTKVFSATAQVAASTTTSTTIIGEFNGASSFTQVDSGSKLALSPGTSGIAVDQYNVGASFTSSALYAALDLQLLAIYPRALTDAEIAAVNTYMSATY